MIAPLVAEWLASLPPWLAEAGILHHKSTVVELGCGITGLLGIILAEHVANYLLTDQIYVMKTLGENVQRNARPKPQKKTRGAINLTPMPQTMVLDWETDSPATILQGMPNADHIDLIIVCDCVYNEHLIQPLVQTLTELCKVGPSDQVSTVLIAQQLRSDSVFEQFLEAILQYFIAWRIPDTSLPGSMGSGSGYVVHLAQLKP